jgi:hypothetical protein
MLTPLIRTSERWAAVRSEQCAIKFYAPMFSLANQLSRVFVSRLRLAIRQRNQGTKTMLYFLVKRTQNCHPGVSLMGHPSLCLDLRRFDMDQDNDRDKDRDSVYLRCDFCLDLNQF